MKVIITGATGFIGHEVLKQCIANPSVASVVVLSRRQPPAPEAAHPKVKVIVLEDFASYSSAVLSEFQGAHACIWALGKPWIRDPQEAKRVSIDYTMAAAQAFIRHDDVARDNDKSKVRFVYLSGAAAERDQEKSLWMLGEYRKIRGQVETELIRHAERTSSFFETYVIRPGFVLKKDFNLRDVARGLMPSVKVDMLAQVMVDVALHGFPRDTLENSQILEKAAGTR